MTRFSIAALGTLLALLAASPAMAGDEPMVPSDDASALLEKTIAELRNTREERYRLEAAHRAEMRSLDARLAELAAGGSTLEPRLEMLEKGVREASAEIAALREDAAKREASLREADRAIDSASARLCATISASIPYRVPERLRAAADALARGPSASGAAKEGDPPREDPVPARARRFQQVLDAEIALGSSTEAFLDRVELGPEDRPRARCLRLGMVGLAFIAEDGKRFGLLVRSSPPGTFRWKLDLSFRERWGLKRGLEILERRRPPVFLDFPADLSAFVPGTVVAGAARSGKEGR